MEGVLGTFSLVKSEERKLNLRSSHKNLSKPWNSERNVEITSSCKMESIQGHLCGGFTDRLSCKYNRLPHLHQ